MRSLERAIISPLTTLYSSTQSIDIRVALLKIFLHVLEVFCLVEVVLDVSRSSLAPLQVVLTFVQCLRIIMNDGLSSIPTNCLHV
ncbi:hypothetical protein DM860_001057 [Cuscuta australis]|uniref:Uncharacterized protein n=1 Tax=Cuscuta australis TaxID=267555 RepID=A0A328DSN1_9ASTE|nr:hypothetical protein DM860_001057 [Cuscuta australis]